MKESTRLTHTGNQTIHTNIQTKKSTYTRRGKKLKVGARTLLGLVVVAAWSFTACPEDAFSQLFLAAAQAKSRGNHIGVLSVPILAYAKLSSPDVVVPSSRASTINALVIRALSHMADSFVVAGGGIRLKLHGV